MDYAARKIKFRDRIVEPLVFTDVQLPLTQEYYQEKFHKLLCWEEMAHINILDER